MAGLKFNHGLHREVSLIISETKIAESYMNEHDLHNEHTGGKIARGTPRWSNT